MSERLIITVDAGNITELTSVQDVFQHVLEMFELVSENESDPEHKVVWRLVSATTNSPLTVVAEAIPRLPGTVIDELARQQKREYAQNLGELRKGVLPKRWQAGSAKKVATSVMLRAKVRVPSTRVIFDEAQKEIAPIEVTSVDAEVAVRLLESNESSLPTKTKEQIGSVEGYLKQASTYHGKPAVLLRSRKDGTDLWCLVPPEHESEFSNETDLSDVWKGKRVLVRGRILYDADNKISRIVATSIKRIDPKEISTESIQDKSFTGGLSAAEYLERLREGTLG